MHPRRGSGATGKPPNWGVSLRWDSALPFGAGQDAAPLRLIGGRKDAPAGRCFLRVQEDTFPGAGYDLSTQKRVEKRLLCPTFYECSAGVVAYAPNEALPRAPQGLCPDFSELARKNCPRQGLPRPLYFELAKNKVGMGGMRFAFGLQLCSSRRITIYFPALRRLRRRCAARARATPLPSKKLLTKCLK